MMSLTELRQWAEKLKLEAGNTRRDASRAEYAADKMLELVAEMEAAPASAPTPIPVPTPSASHVARAPTSSAVASIGTIYVAPGAQTAVVPIRFSKPLEFMQTMRFETFNLNSLAADGQKAYEGGTYKARKEWVRLMPGTTQRDFEITITSFKEGQEIGVKLVWCEDDPRIVDATGKITCSSVTPTVITRVAEIPRPAPPQPGQILFQTDFVQGFKTSPNGGADSFATFHDSRVINDEMAPYTDPSMVPGVDLYPLINGVRHLAIQKLASPIMVNGKSFNFATGMLTMKNRMDTPLEAYVRIKYGMPRDANGAVIKAAGILPAVWGISRQDPWPPERDRMENWPAKGRITFTDHYSDASGAHRSFRHQPPHAAGNLNIGGVIDQIVLQKGDWVYTWLNGELFDMRPNIHPVPMYEILSNALGGGAAGTPGTFAYPILMPIYGMTIAAVG
jgi:hypothetical protein